MRTFTRSVLAASAVSLAALVLPAPANAGLVVQTVAFGPAGTDWQGLSVQSGSFNKFDSSLGTLTGVTVDVATNLSGSVTVAGGTGSNPISINSFNANSIVAVIDPFHPGATCDLSVFGCNTIAGTSAAIVTIGSAQTYTADQVFSVSNVSAVSTDAYSISSGFGSFAATTTTNSGYLADFTGTGSITFDLASFTSLFADFSAGSGNSTLSQETTASANVTLTYLFNAPVIDVPEPASMALLGFGLAAVGAVRRRKAHH